MLFNKTQHIVLVLEIENNWYKILSYTNSEYWANKYNLQRRGRCCWCCRNIISIDLLLQGNDRKIDPILWMNADEKVLIET